jgi:actin-like ATPase involved in cell morphogenesis
MMAAIGMDIGTYNMVCAHRKEDEEGNSKIAFKREVNAFMELSLDKFVFNMMKNAGVPLIEDKENKVFYALGESAVDMAYTMNGIELRRPMKDGCLNPKERRAQEIMSVMMYGLIDFAKPGDTLFYSIPANAINKETDAEYHGMILNKIFSDATDENGQNMGFKIFEINEGLALVYAELEEKKWTGIGVSCLVPGTKIYTKRGIIKIEDVNENDEVLTHKGRWRPVRQVITKKFNGLETNIHLAGYTGEDNCYRFVDNHEIYVKTDDEWQWIGSEEARVGDVVGEPIIGHDRSKGRPTITICERTTCSKTYTKKHIEVSQDVQRLIGYFMGDGSINKDEPCIQFDFASDELDNLEDVEKILVKNFGKSSTRVPKGENATRLKCYSKGLMNWFENHCYNDIREKKYPWSLDRISNGDCFNLLVGLIRSDGWIEDDQLRFSNTNTSLIMLAKQCLARIGYASSINSRPPRQGGEIDGRVICGQKSEWSVIVSGKKCYLSLLEAVKIINCDNCIFMEKIFIENDFVCSRIKKIDTAEYSGIVYDLIVEEDHSFSGPQLTIHNCGAGMVNVSMGIHGAPVFNFSLVNSGDWIDKQASRAIGEETTSFINKEKMKVDLTQESDEFVQRAIKAQYEIMIRKTIQGIKKGLEQAGNKARTSDPIDIVVSGGTSSPKGFPQMFKKQLDEVVLPIKVGNIIRPKDPLYSVARGCLIAAENAY